MGGFFLQLGFRQIRQTFKIFLEGVLFSGVFVTYIRWRVFYSRPTASSKLPNFRIYFWKGERFEGSELLVYNGSTFSQPKPPQQGTLHDGFLVRANSAVRRGKELHIRNSKVLPHPKQGILHKESLTAAQQTHRKEGYRRFRPASAVRLSAQARFRAAKNF